MIDVTLTEVVECAPFIIVLLYEDVDGVAFAVALEKGFDFFGLEGAVAPGEPFQRIRVEELVFVSDCIFNLFVLMVGDEDRACPMRIFISI